VELASDGAWRLFWPVMGEARRTCCAIAASGKRNGNAKGAAFAINGAGGSFRAGPSRTASG